MVQEKPTTDNGYKTIALVLQGGGALGSYQAGVYDSMHQHNLHPNWFAGISIGSINAAILAGNAPENRVNQLSSFWHMITTDIPDIWSLLLGDGMLARRCYAAQSIMTSIFYGIGNFFIPRPFSPVLAMQGSQTAMSFYDTSPLYKALCQHIDFDRINNGNTRLSLGAVNVRTGNFAYFDNTECTIGPEHVMASGALPPGFPPIEIDGEYYWDGGLVSNTPLTYVMDHSDGDTTLIFQVDLFSASGPFPDSIDAVEERRKDIIYSSRTRMNTDAFRELHRLRMAISKLSRHLPQEVLNDPEIDAMIQLGHEQKICIVHLIYRRAAYDIAAKDYEFSRRTMEEHWQAGAEDANHTLRNKAWCNPPTDIQGIAVYDVMRPDV